MSLPDFLAVIVGGLAVARLTMLTIEDRITQAPREAVQRRLNPEGYPAYLLSCAWCSSVWWAVAGYVAWRIWPAQSLAVAAVLAMAYVGARGADDEWGHEEKVPPVPPRRA